MMNPAGSGGCSSSSSSTSCFEQDNHNITNCQGFPQMYDGLEDLFSIASSTTNSVSTSANSYTATLLHNLLVLREKVQQLQSLVAITISRPPPPPAHGYTDQKEPAAATISNAGSLIQEIIVTASSIAYAFQQLVSDPSLQGNELDHQQHTKAASSSYEHYHADISQLANNDQLILPLQSNSSEAAAAAAGRQGIFAASTNNETRYYDVISTNYKPKTFTATAGPIEKYNSQTDNDRDADDLMGKKKNTSSTRIEFQDDHVIELDAADLLAKYTHFCQVCGKGFRRDANLRMHMRAHGDEYKTNAALTNPIKSKMKMMNSSTSTNDEFVEEFAGTGSAAAVTQPQKYYSCPHEGCRWNKKHAKFQPLKSMVCAKNHYKRSHCPKMYVCNRCNRKQFSVLSDLRTHEKHCRDNVLRWRCSCGTSFSRKDKLMGHVALFVGHAPAPLTM